MTLVFGVVNVTPDSFSDGGLHESVDSAVAHALTLVGHGADIIDIGGESTRPGAASVSAELERHRVLPVIHALSAEGVRVSIDTIRASTAKAAVDAGASIINDVSGGAADPLMSRTVAETDATYIIGHWRGIPDPTHIRSAYSDVVVDVRDALSVRASNALRAGVSREQIVLDPGLGFDKNADQSWKLLAGHDELAALGYPVMYGVSRKRMLGRLLEGVPNASTGALDRDLVTAVTSAFIARAGAWAVRVHDVHSTVQALAVEHAWRGGAREPL